MAVRFKYEVHLFDAQQNTNRRIYGTYRLYTYAQQAIRLAPEHSKYLIYAIYDAWNNKYMRFYSNYHPINNPTGTLEKLKDGSY